MNKHNISLQHEIGNILHPLMLTTGSLERLIALDRKDEALKLIREHLRPNLERAGKVLSAVRPPSGIKGVYADP